MRVEGLDGVACVCVCVGGWWAWMLLSYAIGETFNSQTRVCLTTGLEKFYSGKCVGTGMEKGETGPERKI